jgi:hypothetical protein
MIPSHDVGNSPWYFPVHIHWHQCKFEPTSENTWDLVYGVWDRVGQWDSFLRITVGRTLPIHWGYMGHVWLGADLTWKRPVQAGFAGGDYRYPPPDANWIRGCWIDDRYCPTIGDLASAIVHELDHLFGWSMFHGPWSAALRLSGVKEAIRVTRGNNVALPTRSES